MKLFSHFLFIFFLTLISFTPQNAFSQQYRMLREPFHSKLTQSNLSYSNKYSNPFDTGDNENVRLIGRWANGPCWAVAARGDTAYFGNGAYLEIVDFTNPDIPEELMKILVPSPVEAVAIKGNYAYVANGNDGLRVILVIMRTGRILTISL